MNQQNIDVQIMERKALELAAGGHVTRRGGEFVVSQDSGFGETISHSVKRNADGKIGCSCRAAFSVEERCIHIAAVGYAVKLKKTEPQSLPADAIDTSANETQHPESSSSGNVLQMKFRHSVKENVPSRVDTRPERNRANEMRRRLDTLSADWIYSVKSVIEVGGFAVVTGSVTVGGVTREGIGSVRLSQPGCIEGAEEAAFCEASGRFFKSLGEIKVARPANPLAATLGDLISGKQLRMLKALSLEKGVDANTECRSLLGCCVDELSRDAAAFMIGHFEAAAGTSAFDFALVG
jgi:hypothetical protein